LGVCPVVNWLKVETGAVTVKGTPEVQVRMPVTFQPPRMPSITRLALVIMARPAPEGQLINTVALEDIGAAEGHDALAEPPVLGIAVGVVVVLGRAELVLAQGFAPHVTSLWMACSCRQSRRDHPI
jgi:hypothetical protein